jgi:CheY-like chemotaxis protein
MAASVLNRIRILLADDQSEMRMLARQMLSEIGFTNVELAADGSDAYRRFVLNPASLVITDLQMAPVDGMALVRLIRTGPDSPNRFVPIMVLSGNTDEQTVETARDAGINDFLAKPLSVDTLYRHLETLIARPQKFVRSGSYFGPNRRRASSPRAFERRGSSLTGRRE